MEISCNKIDKENKMLRNEVKNLKKCADGLREILFGCQETIYTESSKIQREFLQQTEAVSAAKRGLEVEIESLESANERLKNSVESLKVDLDKNKSINKKLNIDLQDKEYEASRLKIKNKALEERCKCFGENEMKLKNENSDLKEKSILLETLLNTEKNSSNKLAEKLKSSRDKQQKLKVQIQESKANEEFLQEHITELEQLTNSLREQLDSQHKYFVQKEIAAKKEFNALKAQLTSKIEQLENGKNCLNQQIETLNSTIEVKNSSLQSVKKELSNSEKLSSNLKDEIMIIKNSLQLEKDTVELLKQKNTGFCLEIADLKKSLRVNSSSVKNEAKTQNLDYKHTHELQNTLQQYFDESLKSIEESYLQNTELNTQKIVDLESMLSEEQNKRISVELENEKLHEKLKHTEGFSAHETAYIATSKRFNSFGDNLDSNSNILKS